MPIERRPKRARSWKIITSAVEVAAKGNGENLNKRRKLSSSSSSQESQEVAVQTQHDSVDKTNIISNNIRVENKIDDLMEQVMKMRREESSSSEKYESVQNSVRKECDNLRTVFSMMMMEMQESLDRKLDQVSEELRQSRKETETLRTEIEKLRMNSKKDTAPPASLESDDSVKQNSKINVTKDISISRSDSKNAVTSESNQMVHTDSEVLPSHNYNNDDELIFKSHNNNNKKKMSALMRRITKKKRDKATSTMAAVSLKRPVQKSKRLLSSSISSLFETRDGKAHNYLLSLKRRKKAISKDKILRRSFTKKKKIEGNVKLQAASTATTAVKDLTKSIISSCSWVKNGSDRKADQVSSDHHERSETSKVYYSWGDNRRKNVAESN